VKASNLREAARQLPNHVDLERLILGAILVEPSHLKAAAVSVELEVLDFHEEKHRSIFAAMMALEVASHPIDYATVAEQLRDAGSLEESGGIEYVCSLMDGVAGATNVEHYARQVKAAAQKRRILQGANELLSRAWDPQSTIGELVDHAKDLADAAARGVGTNGKPAHWQALDVADVQSWPVRELVWLIEDMIARGTLTFVGAASQTGKTLLLLYVVLQMIRGGQLFGRFRIGPVRRVLYLVLEDPARRIRDRLLDMSRVAIERDRLVVYVAPGFRINDEDSAGLRELERQIREGGFDVVVIDTYQRATPGMNSFDDERQGPILHRLAEMTRELDVAIIVVDHVRKESNGRGRRRELSIDSLKGTGNKPANADAWIMLERGAKGHIRLSASSKDSDRRLGFLLNVAPKGSPEEKFTYAGDIEELADRAAERGEANLAAVLDAITKAGLWVSVDGLQADTKLGAPTVRRHVRTLIDQGRVMDNGRKGRAIRYRISAQQGFTSERIVETDA
jgi:replicative DNA helicase